MFLYLVRRHVLGGCVAALLLVPQLFSDAYAYNPFGRGDRDSTALINAKKTPGPLTTAEIAVILLADPPASEQSELSNKTIVLGYDPAQFAFRPEFSGLLCEFAVGASCPAPSAQYGSVLLANLPTALGLQIGTPLPGSVLNVQNDAVNGIVSVSYQLGIPLVFETAGDRNWFAFHFDVIGGYDPFRTVATFHDQPGNYALTQISASCVSSTGFCGSDIPGYGISLAPVPEPSVLAMWLAGLGAIAAWLPRLRRGAQRTPAARRLLAA